MKALIILLSLNALCVSASPTGSIIAESASSSSSSSSFASCSSSSSSSFSYYSTDVCTALGYNYNIRDYLPTVIFDQVEQQFLEKKCELLNSYGVYPRDIGPIFDNLGPECSNYDIIIVGSGPAGLAAIPQLAALGKRILLIEKGYYAPAACDSLYYRQSLYQSEYVNAYEAYVNGIDTPKKIYTSSLLGGLSALDSNAWNVGSKLLYDQLAQISPEFAWEKVYQRYQALEAYKSYSRTVSVSSSTTTSSTSSTSSSSSSIGSSSSSSSTTSTTSTSTYTYSSSGCYSIYNSYRETYLTRTISSLFEELGYCENEHPFDLSPGFTILPILGDVDRPTLFPYTVFSSLSNTDNIDLALGTTVDQILFNGARASGVQVTTPSGQTLVITANDQVILSTGPISAYQLLFKSGCGPENLLTQFGITPNFNIPSLGQQLILSPIYNGICLKFPKGFIQDYDSDMLNLLYAFGDYEVSPTTALQYYRAYLAVGGSQEANVALQFQAFTKSTYNRLQSYLQFSQYEISSQEYVNSLIEEYDLIFIKIQLLNPRSRGAIYYKDSIDIPYIDSGLYSDDYDIQCMLEAIQQTQALAKAQIFNQYNCEIIQIPINNLNGDFFTDDFNRQSLLYYSTSSIYTAGGFYMGKDYQNAVVDQRLCLLGTENLRVFMPNVSPYPLCSDSIAFSTLIGYYGAEVICNEYNNIFLDTISISETSSSTSIQSSSYSARDIDINSSSYTSTNIDQSGLTGSATSIDVSESSTSYSAVDTSSYSTTSNNIDIDSCDTDILSGGNNVISASSTEYEATQSQSSKYSATSSNLESTVTGSTGSLTSNSQKYSAESSQYESSQYNASQYESSQYEASQYEASQYEASQYEASQYEASQYEASQYEASQYEASQFESSASSVSTDSILNC